MTTGTTPQISFVDTTSSVSFTCDSGTAPGSTTTGTGLSGAGIASIDAIHTTWTNCQGAGFNFSVAGVGTWLLNATSGSSSGATGNISNVNANVTGTGSFGSTCNFNVTGTVPGSYTNSNTTLAVNGAGLTIHNPTGTCASLGVIKDGDAATFQASYAITANNSADNPVHITQP